MGGFASGRASDAVVQAPSLVAGTARAAAAFVEGLDPGRRRVVLHAFADPGRGDWHYAPRTRPGLALKDMTEPQRRAALALLESVLSPVGAAKARGIMALEAVLRAMEGRAFRNPLNYAFSVFGVPGNRPWGWRVEGHHLIVNVTVADDATLAVTPTFWGTNPARVPIGPKSGHRVMREEYLLGLEMARGLDGAQAAQAVFAARTPGNIVTERGRVQSLITPTGLPFTDLRDGQRALLWRLIESHVGKAADAFARPYLDVVHAAGAEQLRLAWAGGMVEGEAFYYRIHGPRLLIEFDCTQNDANHIHTIWRDPVNDWGRDVLGEHYQRCHDHD